jgi:hypothetical protein
VEDFFQIFVLNFLIIANIISRKIPLIFDFEMIVQKDIYYEKRWRSIFDKLSDHSWPLGVVHKLHLQDKVGKWS